MKEEYDILRSRATTEEGLGGFLESCETACCMFAK